MSGLFLGGDIFARGGDIFARGGDIFARGGDIFAAGFSEMPINKGIERGAFSDKTL